MKKLLLVSSLALLLAPCQIQSADKEEVKYEITIEVTYNSTSPEEANKIINDAVLRYKDACKVRVSSEKISDDLITDSGTGIFRIGGGSTTE